MIDITPGMRFGLLTTTEQIGPRTWRCRCDCGGEITVWVCRLLNGSKRTCGCGKLSVGTKTGRAMEGSTLYWDCRRAVGPVKDLHLTQNI